MRILFIGGTGIISSGCSPAVLEAGHELWLLNRGRSVLPAPPGARFIEADINDRAWASRALADKTWDVVVQWVSYRPEQVRRDLDLFGGRTGQYVFISSASVYQKPPRHWLISEASTPLENPFSRYSSDKIACEHLLQDQAEVPWTIVRPSFTYGLSQIPVAVASWAKPFSIIERMRRGAPVIVPGDGTSLWTLTHNTDFARGFVGLLGLPGALGEAFHITSEEALTWNQIYTAVAAAAGVEPNLLHVPTDGLMAADEDKVASLWGDMSHSAVFDNTKIRAAVPAFVAQVPFARGIRETVAWFDADPRRQAVDDKANQQWDQLAAIYADALKRARDMRPA